MKPRIVVFTGAGVSADSGISTFRDADGLWANYKIEEVCTPEALKNNRAKVIEFYNLRRRESLTKQPNDGHRAIASMEEWADVCVVTQNVDNLHEQAGSTRVLHLHGELMKLRSEVNPELIYDINDGWEQTLDARGEDGMLLRPHIVFFGESVPMFDPACKIVSTADILIIVGTSLAVYPAASLVHYVRREVPIYLVDPGNPETQLIRNPLTHIKERGAVGVPQLVERLRNEFAIKG
jgi:NAD-dependent deacetylase